MTSVPSTLRSVDWRRVGNVLGLVVLVVVVAAFVVAAVPGVVGADHSYVVRSDSMSPAIGAGSVVIVSDVQPEAVEAGDVITFETGGAEASNRVTHRVVEVAGEEPRQFLTKGDANEDPDTGLVSEDQVVGRVLFHVPLIGYAIDVAGTDLGLLAFVVLPALVLIALEVRDVVRAWRSGGDPG